MSLINVVHFTDYNCNYKIKTDDTCYMQQDIKYYKFDISSEPRGYWIYAVYTKQECIISYCAMDDLITCKAFAIHQYTRTPDMKYQLEIELKR